MGLLLAPCDDGETQIISIIIPCYNNSQELTRTLHSIANLEIPNNLQVHLVVVDVVISLDE